jgi:putative hydrolase of the HAD superfamily
MRSNPEAGIFDIGGVLMPVDLKPIYQDIMQTLGISEETFTPIWRRLTPLLNTGRITEGAYWQRFLKESGSAAALPDQSLLLREYIPRFSINTDTLGIIRQLKAQGIRLAALSDSVPPHTAFNRSRSLYDEFDIQMLSDEIGVNKSNPRAFLMTLARLKTRPEQTFFVDDLEININMAQTLGIQGILFEDPRQLKKELKKLGLRVV